MTTGMKKVALVLYRLGEKERCWMLEKLPNVSRNQIKTLIDQLEELGLPKGCSVWSGLDDQTTSIKIPETEPKERKLPKKVICAVDRILPDYAASILNDEPIWVIVAVLSYSRWIWCDGYLSLIGEEKSKQIARLMSNTDTKNTLAVQEALIRCIYDLIIDNDVSNPGEDAEFEHILDVLAENKSTINVTNGASV